jgi:hypothetical protein
MTRRRQFDPPPPPDVRGGDLAGLARRYRDECIATLISIQRDPRAPATARAQAASRLMEYSDGRPVSARAIGVNDLASMTPDQREELWHALMTHYETEMPGELKRQYQEAVEEVLHAEIPLRAFITSLKNMTDDDRQKPTATRSAATISS